MRRIIILLLAVGCIYGASSLFFRFQLRAADAGSQERVTVTIEQGASTAGIAGILEENGIIRSAFFFEMYARLNGHQGTLQAGKFVLRASMPVPEIIAVLQTGRAEEMIVTIPEGFTVKDIDALLVEKGLIEEGDFTLCAKTCDFSSFEFIGGRFGLADRGGKVEGYLFPDTYFIVADEFVTKFFLERLLTTFRKRVIEPLADQIASSKYSLHEIMTMASLIEEETRTDHERATVSGILWKRYDADLGLGVDATVRYILDKQTGTLTVADLNTNSPYNTRKFRGLPPGPIASPSLKSIRAALNPQESPYWYYLHGSDGQIRYAETNEEHNINKYEYLR